MQPNGQWQPVTDDSTLRRESTPTVILPMSEAAPSSFENALNNIPQLPQEKAAHQAAQDVVQRPDLANPLPTQQPPLQPQAQSTQPMQPAQPSPAAPYATAAPEARVPAMTTRQSMQEIQPVYWEGVEYIQRNKDKKWFIIFGVVVALFIGLGVWQAFEDLFSGLITILLVGSIAAAIITMAKKPPRLIKYTLSKEGLYVNEELHRLEDFRAFGVLTDDGEYSVFLIPVKRFSIGLTVYFPKESGEQIVDMLGQRLPMQPLKLDIIEKFIRKIRL